MVDPIAVLRVTLDNAAPLEVPRLALRAAYDSHQRLDNVASRSLDAIEAIGVMLQERYGPIPEADFAPELVELRGLVDLERRVLATLIEHTP